MQNPKREICPFGIFVRRGRKPSCLPARFHKRRTIMTLLKHAQRLWKKGLSYAKIGEAIGLTRQKTQQLFRPSQKVRLAVKKIADWKCEKCGKPVKNGHVHHKSLRRFAYLCATCHVLLHSKHKPVPYRILKMQSKQMRIQRQQMRALRENKDLSVREVARRLGLSANYVSDLELGRRAFNTQLIHRYKQALSK